MSVSERNVQSLSHGKINMNTNTFEAPNELVFVPVWIANSVTKNVDRKGDTMLKTNDVVHGCVCLEAGVLLDIFSPYREDFVED